jgi:HEAT repeat protein
MNCPTCGKPVDPLRAPAVRVTAGKVVPYCSKECAAAAESQSGKIVPTKVVRMPTADLPTAKPKTKTPAAGTDFDLDSGPVIQVLHEPATGVVTSAADPRQGRARSNPRAETDGAIQIADTGHIDDFVSYDEPRSKLLVVALLLVVVVVGAGAAAYFLGYFDGYLGRNSKVATSKTVETPKPEPVVADAPPPLTPEVAIERAKSVLHEQMKSNSPRVQRVAASALARTGDAEAIQQLVVALAKETSDTAKLDIAYALARGGDKRGLEALMAAVGSGKRDPRLEAGRRLALLGDKRAIRALETYLEVSQLRLGVAEQLAYIAEPRAIKALEEIRASDKAVPDEKARATIALGHAGRADIAPALRELLTDGRNNAFAAIALAGLHDEAARPVLLKQLAIPSLRVQAARALRRLAPDADVKDQLPALLAALDNNRDTEQVQIAEAILLLAGPSTWSERE